MPAADQNLLQNGVLIAGTIALVIIGLFVIKLARLQSRPASDESVDLLEQFREAYEAGEMDSAEFRRVRESLDRPRPVAEVVKPRPADIGPSQDESESTPPPGDAEGSTGG